MALAKVCRICLITDVKLHDLRSYPLDSYYDSVMGTNPQYTNLSPYACYECAALVRKFYFFRQKCLRSQEVLHGVTDNYGKVKPSDLQAINRQDAHIYSKLEVINLPEINISCLHPDTEVKLETSNEEFDEDKFKLEDHNYACFNSMDHNISSDDDEPLSLHKEKKIQNKDNMHLEVENTTMKEEFDGVEFTVATNDGNSELADDVSKPKLAERKKKKRWNRAGAFKHRKELINPSLNEAVVCDKLEQFVTVITLSLEEQIEEVKKRKESSNYLNSPYQCNLCFKGFIDDDAWKHHVSKHAASAGNLECKVCKFRFKTKRAYYKHASNHEKKFACKSCDYVSTNMTQAKQHQGWHKGITYKCKYCDETFTIWTSYMSHTRIKHPSEFICGVCGYSFISKLGLSMHKSMMHKDILNKQDENTEEGPYCEECDVKFISTEAYKRHMVMSVKHTQSTDSIKGCRTCGATFENSEELRLHHRKEHSRKRPKNYGKKPSNTTWPATCEHCPEEIPNAREYWTHFRRMHPDKKYPVQKNYVCDICGKSFRGNAFLVYHKRTHFEERAYKCGQCDKAFYNRTNLQVHEKTHSDVRPYPCAVCCKAFKCKGALNRHFRVHEELYSDIRPFPCSACSKTFKFKGALDRHFVSHTGEKPYECEVCGREFSQSNSRKVHVRTVHLKQPTPYISRNRLERRKQGTGNKEPTAQPFVY